MIQEQNFILNVFKIESSRKSLLNYNSEKESEEKSKNDLNNNTSDEKSSENINYEKEEEKKEDSETNINNVWDTLDIEKLSEVHEPLKDVKTKNKILYDQQLQNIYIYIYIYL